MIIKDALTLKVKVYLTAMVLALTAVAILIIWAIMLVLD